MELVVGRTLRALVGDAAVPIRERVRILADARRPSRWRVLGPLRHDDRAHHAIRPRALPEEALAARSRPGAAAVDAHVGRGLGAIARHGEDRIATPPSGPALRIAETTGMAEAEAEATDEARRARDHSVSVTVFPSTWHSSEKTWTACSSVCMPSALSARTTK
jgi:hypothetical protein